MNDGTKNNILDNLTTLKNSTKYLVKTACLSSILVILILLLSLKYRANTIDKNLYFLLMIIFISILTSLFVSTIKKIINNSNNVDSNANDVGSNPNNTNIVSNNIDSQVKKHNIEKKVRFNTPLKEYEILNDYRNDFFTFRDILYQNSSNDFDYADIMNNERDNMLSNKNYKGKIWDLYDDLTKPDYSKIPVNYDQNIKNDTTYYPVTYKGPVVKIV